MAPPLAFVSGPALPLRRAPGVAVTSTVSPRRPAGVAAAPRMMADKKEGGGLFGIKMPSMPSFGGGKKKAAAATKGATNKTKAAVNQFQAKAPAAAGSAAKGAAATAQKAASKVEEAAEERFMDLQPGDAGYVEPKIKAAAKSAATDLGAAAKGAAKDAGAAAKGAAKDAGAAAMGAAKDAGAAVKAATPSNVKAAAGKAADAVEDVVDSVVGKAKPGKRGVDLLREDFLRSAPERIGVGRQDTVETAAPTYGEPGYKYSAYETAKQSTLGISSFSDDANAAEKVGGLDALKKAAVEARKGATAAQLKAKALRIEKAALAAAASAEETNGLPDYLLPLPEDTPRKYSTWKNYDGR